MKAVADVLESLGFRIWTVRTLREVIHNALTVTVLFLGPEFPGSDAADDRVQVIPFRLTIVLQQASALQIRDGVRKAGIEGAQRGVIDGFGQQRHDG